jgi:hypothetical protein
MTRAGIKYTVTVTSAVSSKLDQSVLGSSPTNHQRKRALRRGMVTRDPDGLHTHPVPRQRKAPPGAEAERGKAFRFKGTAKACLAAVI